MVPVVALERQERVKTTSELAAVPRPQTMPHLCGLVYFTALLCLQVGAVHGQTPPTVNVGPDLITGLGEIVAGSNIQLYCEAQSDDIAPSIVWDKDAVTLENNPPNVYFRTSSFGNAASSVLNIGDFQDEDDGMYSCTASIPADGGGAISSTEAVLMAVAFVAIDANRIELVRDPFTRENTYDAFEDNRVVAALDSPFDSDPTPRDQVMIAAADLGSFRNLEDNSIVWVRNGELVAENGIIIGAMRDPITIDPRYTIVATATDTSDGAGESARWRTVLTIDAFQASDAGVYQVIFTNSAISGSQVLTTTPIRLDTDEDTTLTRLSPAIIDLVVGSHSLLIEVAASGGYQQISWERNGAALPSSGPFFNHDEVYYKETTDSNDLGEYRIIADSLSVTVAVLPYKSPTTTIMGSATVAIMEGDSTNIVCTSTGVLTPTIEWELLGSASLPFTPVDGTPLEPNITEVVPLEFTEGNLTSTFPIINAVFPDHDGMYRCTGTNAHNGVPATGAATAQITIQVAPEVEVTASRTRIQLGGTITLTCTVIRSNPSDIYTYTLGLLPSMIVDGPTDMTVETNALDVTFSTVADYGTYQCSVENSAALNGSDDVIIEQGFPPEVNISGGPTAPTTATVVDLICVLIDGDLTITYQWINVAAESVILSTNASFTATVSGEVTYRCMAMNEFGTATAEVNVVEAIAPITPASTSMEVQPGQELRLSVDITDFNLPITVTWTHEGRVVTDGVDRISIMTSPNLSMPPVTSTLVRMTVVSLVDAGEYAVMGVNSAGSSQTIFTVSVIVAPTILDPATPEQIEVIEGDAVTLTCTAFASPASIIEWFVNNSDTALMSGDFSGRLTISSEARQESDFFYTSSNLTIDLTQNSDTGMYVCIAMNSLGNDQADLTLAVEFIPTSVASSTSIALLASSSEPSTVPVSPQSVVSTTESTILQTISPLSSESAGFVSTSLLDIGSLSTALELPVINQTVPTRSQVIMPSVFNFSESPDNILATTSLLRTAASAVAVTPVTSTPVVLATSAALPTPIALLSSSSEPAVSISTSTPQSVISATESTILQTISPLSSEPAGFASTGLPDIVSLSTALELPVINQTVFISSQVIMPSVFNFSESPDNILATTSLLRTAASAVAMTPVTSTPVVLATSTALPTPIALLSSSSEPAVSISTSTPQSVISATESTILQTISPLSSEPAGFASTGLPDIVSLSTALELPVINQTVFISSQVIMPSVFNFSESPDNILATASLLRTAASAVAVTPVTSTPVVLATSAALPTPIALLSSSSEPAVSISTSTPQSVVSATESTILQTISPLSSESAGFASADIASLSTALELPVMTRTALSSSQVMPSVFNFGESPDNIFATASLLRTAASAVAVTRVTSTPVVLATSAALPTPIALLSSSSEPAVSISTSTPQSVVSATESTILQTISPLSSESAGFASADIASLSTALELSVINQTVPTSSQVMPSVFNFSESPDNILATASLLRTPASAVAVTRVTSTPVVLATSTALPTPIALLSSSSEPAASISTSTPQSVVSATESTILQTISPLSSESAGFASADIASLSTALELPVINQTVPTSSQVMPSVFNFSESPDNILATASLLRTAASAVAVTPVTSTPVVLATSAALPTPIALLSSSSEPAVSISTSTPQSVISATESTILQTISPLSSESAGFVSADIVSLSTALELPVMTRTALSSSQVILPSVSTPASASAVTPITRTSVSITPTVLSPLPTTPTIVNAPEDQTAIATEDVTFTCQATASPRPHIIWQRVLANGSRIEIEESTGEFSINDAEIGDRDLRSNLTILSAMATDAGEYVCAAVNVVGSTEEFVGLAVTAQPAECGNGVLEGVEACDDNNTMAFDGCSENCTVEEDFMCSQDPDTGVSVCSAILLDLNSMDNTTLGYTAEFTPREVFFLSNTNETSVTFIGGNWTLITILVLEVESMIAEEVGTFAGDAVTAGRLSLDQIIAFRDMFIQRTLVAGLDLPEEFDGSNVVSGVEIYSGSGFGMPFTPEEVDILLLKIGYRANQNEPGYDTRRVCVIAENAVYSTAACVGLFFIGLNDDAPSVEYVMEGVAEFIEQQAEPVVIVNGSITVSDPDHPTEFPIVSAEATIVDFVSGEVLSVTYELPGFTYNFDDAAGTLTITGSAPAAEYGPILANITYFNDMSEPVSDLRRIEIRVFDGIFYSDERTATIDVTIVNVNDQPAVSLDGEAPIVSEISINFTEGAVPVTLAPNLVVVDSDPAAMIVRVSVQLTNPIDDGQEMLAVADTTSGLSVSRNDYSVNITGVATASVYTDILRTLTYVHSDANPGNPTSYIVRRIEFRAEDDQGASSDSSVVMLTIIPVNDPPILLYVSNDTLRVSADLLTDGVMAASFNYTEDDPALNFGRDIYLRDIDSSMLATTTINLTGLLNGVQDCVTFDANLLGLYGVNVAESVSNGGENRDILLEGVATLEQHEAILRSMAYSNLLTNNSVQSGQRNATITTQDVEGESSNEIVAYITVMSRNDMPIIDLGGGENMDFTITYVENEPSIAVAVFHLTSLMDEEDHDISSLSITLLSTNGMLDAGEAIFLRTPTALPIFFDPRNSFDDTFIYVEMNSTTADYVELLQLLRYVNTDDEPTLTNAAGDNITREVVIQITDANFGNRATTEIRVGIEIQPVNDNAPRIFIDSLPASCTEDFRDQGIVVTRSRREVRSASKQRRKRMAYDFTDGDNSNAPQLTGVYASLSRGSCLQNVTLIFNADTSAPSVEIQHDLHFLLYFDPPELNWVAHHGLWLDYKTLVIVFGECVVWERATTSGRERPMFVAFEAQRGSCNETSPCHNGVCFSNSTGCPLTGYHQILTNKSRDCLEEPPVTPSNAHMYYSSLIVTVVIIAVALLVMVWTAQNRMAQKRNAPPLPNVLTKTVTWSANSELPSKCLKPVTTLSAQTAIDISPPKAPDNQDAITPLGTITKAPLEELSNEYKPTTLSKPHTPPPFTPSPASSPNKLTSRANRKATSPPRVKKTTPSGKDPPLPHCTPDEIAALEATAVVSLTASSPHLPTGNEEKAVSQTEQQVCPDSCSRSSQGIERLGANRQPWSHDTVTRGNHPTVSREHLHSCSSNNSTDRQTLHSKMASEH